MKLFLLLLSLFLVQIAHTQLRDENKTRQIQQLQQLKQTLARKIDTLQLQLIVQANSLEDTRKKLEQLKKESSSIDKPDMEVREQESKLSQEQLTMTNLARKLQKKFDQQLLVLDKAINLQKDLEEKIEILLQVSNQ